MRYLATMVSAAGRALECDGDLYAGGGANYADGGLESVQGNPTNALFSYDVLDQTKIAFIAADGITDFNHETGWGVESWAQCDPVEFPESVTDALDIGVWQDASGARLPVAKIQSNQGAEHCNWQDITFLQLGSHGQETVYVRDVHGEFKDFLRTGFDAAAILPPEATDTGMRRAGRQLWLSPKRDAAYLVKVGDANDVEQWPAEAKAIGCA